MAPDPGRGMRQNLAGGWHPASGSCWGTALPEANHRKTCIPLLSRNPFLALLGPQKRAAWSCLRTPGAWQAWKQTMSAQHGQCWSEWVAPAAPLVPGTEMLLLLTPERPHITDGDPRPREASDL